MDFSIKVYPTHPPSTVKVNGKSLVDFFFKQPPHYLVNGLLKCIIFYVKPVFKLNRLPKNAQIWVTPKKPKTASLCLMDSWTSPPIIGGYTFASFPEMLVLQGMSVSLPACSSLCRPGRECRAQGGAPPACLCTQRCPDHWNPVRKYFLF